MQIQACQPCARRKVRCDRKEPCSNCQRRKQDQCLYAEVSPTERIKQLEALVRDLEQSSKTSNTPIASPRSEAPPKIASSNSHVHRGTEPMIVKENGGSNYLESSSWHGWNGKIAETWSTVYINNGYPVMPTTGSSALQSIICRDPYIDLGKSHPLPRESEALWDIFFRRVHPVTKITFNQELDQIHSTVMSTADVHKLSPQSHAFVFALYLLSVICLSEEECSSVLGRGQPAMISHFQMLCEQALASSNFLGASDLITMEAAIMYITAGIERLNIRSIWSLMGAVIRNAERCGLHRDGSILGLSPYETERRRRLWWQLQHLDLALGVRSGSISLSLNAPWDAKLPLNIEDEDIDPHMREFPKERDGLTSMSPCLWTYWVIYEQRSFCRADGSITGFSWAADKTISRLEKDTFIDRLDVGLRKRYLQFCDPIQPRDMLVQIVARSFICAMRRITLHPAAHCGRLSELSEDHRKTLLEFCMQALEYDIALHSNPAMKDFLWRFQHYFQWSALVYVLVEARRNFDKNIAGTIWALLSRLYTVNTTLSEILEDRRKSYAVELMLVAWKTRETYRALPKPAFLIDLERKLAEITEGATPSKRKLDEIAAHDRTPAKKHYHAVDINIPDLSMENTALSQHDLDAIGDLDFDAIDWSFWESLQS